MMLAANDTTDLLLQEGQSLRPADAAVALIAVGDAGYLVQLRDKKPNIFFPGHWGVFGGAVDAGETPEQALRRELREELGLIEFDARYFTRLVIDFGYGGTGVGDVARHYFEVRIDPRAVDRLTLGEGRAMRVLSAQELLSSADVVPYDALAVWMHATRERITIRPA
jgi:8-oxo-dGTP pyrophosphatase MutT (NUDIX family)